MKRLYYILFCLLFSCQLRGQQATLIIIPEKENKEISYQFSDSEHLPFYTLFQTKQAEPDGVFHISLPVQQPVVLNLLTEDRLSFRVYLTKDSHDTIRIRNNQPFFSGTNTIYNQCLQEIQKTEEYCHSISYSKHHELHAVDSLKEFTQIVNNKQAELITFLKGQNVSSDFIHNQSHIINCMFTHLFYKKILNLYNNRKITDEWLKEIKKQLSFDFQEEANLCYSEYERMLYMNTTINYFIIEKHSPQDIDRDKINTFLLNEYKKKRTGKYLEYAWASLIYNDIFQRDFSEDIPSLYDQFCSEFPQSEFIGILSPEIEKIRQFHHIPETSNNITILPTDTILKNLEEAVHPFIGKIVYIDLWGTWCGPCQKMFAYSKALKNATKKMDIIYLYISLDRPENRDKWKKMVYYYKLEGYHLQAGITLAKSLYASLGNKGMLAIPQFIIIGKDGKIAIEKAAAPDNLEKVVEQLKQVSNE